MTHRHERQRDRREGEIKNDKERRHTERRRRERNTAERNEGKREERGSGEGEKTIKRDVRVMSLPLYQRIKLVGW